MRKPEALEPGVMFWAGRDNLAEIEDLGARCGQLGIGGDYAMSAAAIREWDAAFAARGFAISTAVAAYSGEDYADIPTVERTVGFIPPATRAARVQRTLELSDFAAALGIPGIACHIGFVPEDREHPDYTGVREQVRRICDHAAAHRQTFALETGQEPAASLLGFLRDVDRPNLGINFDPANMILYGTGDPIEALELLRPHVISVHCKDGDWPPADKPGALGSERPLGQGSVGIPRFIGILKETKFQGSLNVEREVENQPQRLREIAGGLALVRSLLA